MNEASVMLLGTVSGWVQTLLSVDPQKALEFLNVVDSQRACKSHDVSRSGESVVRLWTPLFVRCLSCQDSFK